jgi:undecaprenyl diphosphate synthase
MTENLIMPSHIAFIMDGNGRWAKKRLLSRNMGHKEGVKALKKVIEKAETLNIKVLTFFAFSTENWKRPKEEVDALFSMIEKFVNDELTIYSKKNMIVRFMGDISVLPQSVKEAINKVISLTSNNSGMIINIGLNYGSRQEIAYAVNKIIADGIKTVDENIISKYLYTNGLPDPDIIVRTSGEERLSNFMLYQSAYSELIFVDELWPDFDGKSLLKVIEIYNKRDRRFGGIPKEK